MTEKMSNDTEYEYQEIFSKKYLGIGYEDIEDFASKQDLEFTDDPTKAIYLFPNGEMIDGWSKEARLYGGPRDSDHGNRIDGLIPDLNRYVNSDKFWIRYFEQLNFVLLVPETCVAICAYNQKLTKAQECVLEELDYQVDYSECDAHMVNENRINEKYHVEIYGDKKDSMAIKEVLKNAYDRYSDDGMSMTPYTYLHEDTVFINIEEEYNDNNLNLCKYGIDIECESCLDFVDAIRYIGLNCPRLEQIIAYDTKGDIAIDTNQIKEDIVADKEKEKQEQERRELEKIAKRQALEEKQKMSQKPKDPNLFNILDNMRKMPFLIENNVLKDISCVYGGDGSFPLFTMVKKIKEIGLKPMLQILDEKVNPLVLKYGDDSVKKEFKFIVNQIKIIEPKFEPKKEQKINVNIDFKALKQTNKTMKKAIQKENQHENDERD